MARVQQARAVVLALSEPGTTVFARPAAGRAVMAAQTKQINFRG